MKRILCLILLALSGTAAAQSCEAEVARADLRGLKLGEPLAQFKKRFPQARDTTAALEKRETDEGGIHLFANEHPLGKDINYAFLIYQDRKISDINLPSFFRQPELLFRLFSPRGKGFSLVVVEE